MFYLFEIAYAANPYTVVAASFLAIFIILSESKNYRVLIYFMASNRALLKFQHDIIGYNIFIKKISCFCCLHSTHTHSIILLSQF